MSSVRSAVLIMGFLASTTFAQGKLCLKDDDCMRNQYCHPTSKNCTAFVNCTRLYHREEASHPSRTASECGNCIEKYSPKNTPQSNSEPAICLADNPDWSSHPLIVRIFVSCILPVCVVGVLGWLLKQMYNIYCGGEQRSTILRWILANGDLNNSSSKDINNNQVETTTV